MAAQENRALRVVKPRPAVTNAGSRGSRGRPLSVEEVLALPASVDLETAGRALGLGRTKTNDLARAGEFPIPILILGRRSRRCTKAHICQALGLSVHP